MRKAKLKNPSKPDFVLTRPNENNRGRQLFPMKVFGAKTVCALWLKGGGVSFFFSFSLLPPSRRGGATLIELYTAKFSLCELLKFDLPSSCRTYSTALISRNTLTGAHGRSAKNQRAKGQNDFCWFKQEKRKTNSNIKLTKEKITSTRSLISTKAAPCGWNAAKTENSTEADGWGDQSGSQDRERKPQ